MHVHPPLLRASRPWRLHTRGYGHTVRHARATVECRSHAAAQVDQALQAAPQQSSPPADQSNPHLVRRPCSSPCAANDARCYCVEALLQNIVGYPRMPTKVYKRLDSITSPVGTMETLLLSMVDTFGSEMTWHMLDKAPLLLDLKFSVLHDRYCALAEWLGLSTEQMVTVLKKNPHILCIAPNTLRQRYQSLQELTHYTPDQMLTLVQKCPLVFNWNVETLRDKLLALKSLASNRELWEDEVEYLTPSLLAFFIRDANDLLCRLEYLVLTGESPRMCLRDVFKCSNNLFGRKHKGFRAWLRSRKEEVNSSMPRSSQQQEPSSAYTV